MPDTPSQTIKVRTGEMRVFPGFWWAMYRATGESTIVQIKGTGFDNELTVTYIGSDQTDALSATIDRYEIMAWIDPDE